MAVYKRRYNSYTGSLTPEWSRFYVLARYAFADLFKSRVFVTLLILALVPTLGFAGYIFVANNKTVQLLLQLRNVGGLFEVEAQFFGVLLIAQTQLAFLLNCWVGPTLVSGDLTNGALPLFLSRPFSRAEYVIGKLTVLAILLSVVTWVPGLLLFGLQSGLASNGWLWSHLWMTVPIVFCSAIWILMLSLVSLAISAWFKLRIVATGVTFIAFIIPAAIGGIFNAIMHTAWGNLLNFPELFRRIVMHAFREDLQNVRISGWNDIPIPIAWLMLVLVCIFALLLLNARLRAREVVRG
jgi:ABC-2 type transport system permease protein